MRSWIACLNSLAQFLSIFLLLFLFVLISNAYAQNLGLKANLQPAAGYGRPNFYSKIARPDTVANDSLKEDPDKGFPDPHKVLLQSVMIPGWGQITNHQIWKVPIVYGLLGGLTYYSIYLNKSYHDYRAAYYNLNPDTADDFRFGPTPAYIPENSNLQQLRTQRNSFRNKRDFAYIYIALAYGLNIADAYVFAQMRSFDVSEDLSMRPQIQPGLFADVLTTAPMITFKINFVTR